MKRLFVVTHKMTGGGCERVVAQLVNRFAADGVETTLVAECRVPSFYPLDGRVKQAFLLDGETMRARDVPRAYLALRRMVRAERPDAVLALPEKVNVWTVLFLLGTGVPVTVSERNDPHRHPERAFKRLLRRLVYPFAAGFIFQTQDAANYFSASIRRRGTVLDNPLDCGGLPPPNTGAREKTLVGAGRFHAQKDFPLLIAAFAGFYQTHPDWRLILYGEGERRAELERLCRELLPEGAYALPGQTKRLAEALGTCGAFALSSEYEGMPNALIEAMAMGAPCVATDCPIGGVAALVRDGENGLLVPVHGADELRAAIERLADEEGLARRLSEHAVRVRERLEAGRVYGQWRSYLERIAAK